MFEHLHFPDVIMIDSTESFNAIINQLLYIIKQPSSPVHIHIVVVIVVIIVVVVVILVVIIVVDVVVHIYDYIEHHQ